MNPVYLKTYGKQRRKLSAWISADNHRQAFDSTLSTEGDVSLFEPSKSPKVRKVTVPRPRAARRARKKAVIDRSSDEENIPSPLLCPRPAQKRKATREKKSSVCQARAGRPPRRKAAACPIDISSDEENSSQPSPPPPLPLPLAPQHNNTTRKSVPVSAPCQQLPVARESGGEDSTSSHKHSVDTKKDSSVHLPPVSRFVTRRRCPVAAKPQPPRATLGTLNTSDDFAPRAFGSSRVFGPSRRRRRGKVALLLLSSSAENSVNVAGTSGLASAVPFREISLNESADHSLHGPGSRRPIFCSTPSAAEPLGGRPRLKTLSSVDGPSFASPSMSVSNICVANTFQDDFPDSPPASSAPPAKRYSGEKPQPSSLGEQEPDPQPHEQPSVDVFQVPKSGSFSDKAPSPIEDTKPQSFGEPQSAIWLSSEDGGGSSRFVSAAGGLQWLVEALKEACLTERCTVELERLDSVAAALLCGQTTYSSCLDHSASVHHSHRQTKEHPPEPSLNLQLSVTDIGTHNNYSQSVNGSTSPERAPPGTDGESATNSATPDFKQTASALNDKSAAARDASLTKNCTVRLRSLDTKELEGFVRQLEASCPPAAEKSPRADANRSENERTRSEDCGEENPARRSEGIAESETATTLREECLSDRVHVKVERLTLSQLKGTPQPKGEKRKAPAHASDSTSDDQTESDHQPTENDDNLCHKNTSEAEVTTGSTSSEDKAASDREAAAQKARADVPCKRKKDKKASLAPKAKKRRSTSADRPGTSRKACVSGMSVSRWKSKDVATAAAFRGNRTVDCSINEFMPTKQPRELTLSTPVRAGRLNLSSLLADMTPSNTHTWSRLKAALSVHRKGMVLHTPSRVAMVDLSQDLFGSPLRTPLPKHLRSQLRSLHSTVCEDSELSDAEKVYAECGQQRPLPWEECIAPGRMQRCLKIGEGTFGEVFSTHDASGDTVALKIIPIEGSEKVNGEEQKTLGEILHEIIISKELSSLKDKQKNQTRGFIGLNDLHCVQGGYPADFLKAWDHFDQKKGSENDRPDFFEKDQLFIILEFEFGGADLENSNGTLASLGVAKSILHQVTAAMAVAEQELHFEHRDLHWGNVLVKATKERTGDFLLNGTAHSVENKGVLVRIIDYSLSRLEIDQLTVSCDISADEELFSGQGDYQFDIYRLMRQENGNNWSEYHPHSNVLWLHYLCSKLLSMKYRGSGGRGARDTRLDLTRFHDSVLQYGSATETLLNCPMFH